VLGSLPTQLPLPELPEGILIEDPLGLALQIQIAGQANVNVQNGIAVATAVSDEVKVWSQNDPAGGDGINATSSADAVAFVGQSGDQDNLNEASATFTAPEDTDEGENDIVQLDGLDLGVQGDSLPARSI
jgi:hypothetical protein